jgi:serine phosphatase RsbU (regulator of sigma subunit)
MANAEATRRVSGRLVQRLPPWAAGTLAFLLVGLGFSALVALLFWRTQAAMIGEIHAGLQRTARIAVQSIDVGGHGDFTSPTQHLSPDYQQAIAPLRAVLAADPEVAFAWTVVEREGVLHFVLDGSTPRPGDTTVAPDWVQIMEVFENPPADLFTAIREGRSVVSQPYTDEWGSFISAFEPLKNAEGRTVAALGIDLRLTQYEARLAPVQRAALLALGVGWLVAFGVGLAVWVSRRTDRTARELARQLRTVNALLAVSRALSTGVRLDELLPVIVAQTTEVMGAERSGLLLEAPADDLAQRALREGQLQRTRHRLVLPIRRGDGQTLGALEVVNKLGEDDFDRDDEVLLEALGSLVLMAFDRARLTEVYVEKQKLDEALKLAASIQMSMVPQAFPKPGTTPIEVHAQLLPAKEVGGDFYDFFWLDAHRMALVMADVSGKAMPAALFMAKAKTLVKAAALLIDGPDEILRRANEELSADNDAGMFVTVFLGILDTRDGRLHYSNAGHNPPLRMSAGKVSTLDGADGVALGVMEGLDYRSAELALQHGDVLFLFTDGVNEAMDVHGQPWGQAAMEAAFAATEGTMHARNEAMVAAIRKHADGAEQSDDIALLMVRWR